MTGVGMKMAMWVYPWDFWDEGPEVAADRIRSLGVTEVRLAVSYHRAEVVTPRSHNRRLLLTQDGVYFSPDTRYYAETTLRPIQAPHPQEGLEPLMAACRRAGLDVTAWVVLLNNWSLGEQHPEATVENAWGDRLPFSFCPSRPSVAGYAAGLVQEVAERFPVDGLELEAWHPLGVPYNAMKPKSAWPLDAEEIELIGLCFCDHCHERARKVGLDSRSLADWVRQQGTRSDRAEAPPDLDAYRGLRADCVTELVTRVRGAGRGLPVRLFSVPPRSGKGLGIQYERLAPLVDGIIAACYGTDPAQEGAHGLEARHRISSTTAALDISLRVAEPGVPERLERLVEVMAPAAPDSFSFYQYGQITDEGLAAIRRVIDRSR